MNDHRMTFKDLEAENCALDVNLDSIAAGRSNRGHHPVVPGAAYRSHMDEDDAGLSHLLQQVDQSPSLAGINQPQLSSINDVRQASGALSEAPLLLLSPQQPTFGESRRPMAARQFLISDSEVARALASPGGAVSASQTAYGAEVLPTLGVKSTVMDAFHDEDGLSQIAPDDELL